MKKDLPLAVMETLLKKSGAQRIGESAKSELSHILEKRTEAVCKKATVFSRHGGRKTLKKEDINLAIRP